MIGIALLAISWSSVAITDGLEEKAQQMEIETSTFGNMPDGTEAHLYKLKNGNDVTVTLTDYGARIVSVEFPDRNGKVANVVLGFDSLDKYLKHTAYFGCTTGRFANRIAKGKFKIDGKEFQVTVNNGGHHLHGGNKGIDKKLWTAMPLKTDKGPQVTFVCFSEDGEEGYPGKLEIATTYLLTNENSLVISYTAKTSAPTVINLTNHAYWNLAGEGTILDHELIIDAEKYVKPDGELIPTGELADLKGTPLDFTTSTKIGARMSRMKEGPPPGGYDHCYVLRSTDGKFQRAAVVVDPKSGRKIEIHTTEPGVQFYTGNFLDGGLENGGFVQHAAFCLETQHFPDSPNQPAFPSTTLRPGKDFESKTEIKFSWK